MISYVRANLFESPAQTLVNTVNTVGVMGKGVALTFKKIYPEMFEAYRHACESGELVIGRLHTWPTARKLILNFPTKEHWRNPSKPHYIEAGLRTFVRSYEAIGIHSVAFPPLGCGNGELDFATVVQPLMERYLGGLPIPVLVYAPHPRSAPAEHRLPRETKRWLREEPADLPFTEVWDDLLEAIGDGRLLTTFTRGSEFRVTVIPSALRVEAAGRTVTYHREEMLDLWKELRTQGLITAATTPTGQDRDASYLLPIFDELPYVKRVSVGDSYANYTSNPAIGLQLMIPPKDKTEQLSFA